MKTTARSHNPKKGKGFVAGHLRAPRSAYIHVPFCAMRCGYCNFTVVADRDDLVPRYLQAIELELNQLEFPRPVDTVFLGGGTPTQLDAKSLARLLQLVCHWFPLEDEGEFSVEANPGQLDTERTAVLSEAGVNRISLGAQSFDTGKLIALERTHDRHAIEQSFAMARETGAQVSLDLIFAAPGERLATWKKDLSIATKLGPDHISTYGLTIERGSQFWNRRNRGHLRESPEETQREMYVTAIETLSDAGFDHYEVSNFAQPGRSSLHNEAYWKGRTYFGVGPGAARYVDGRRELNHRSTTTYIRRMLAGNSPLEMTEELNDEERARERLVFGLRMLSGVEEQEFERETGFSIDQLAKHAIDHFCHVGMLTREAGHLRLTRGGLLVSDSLWPRLLIAT